MRDPCNERLLPASRGIAFQHPEHRLACAGAAKTATMFCSKESAANAIGVSRIFCIEQIACLKGCKRQIIWQVIWFRNVHIQVANIIQFLVQWPWGSARCVVNVHSSYG